MREDSAFGSFTFDGHADDRCTVIPDYSGITWHPPDDSSLVNDAHGQLIRYSRELVVPFGHTHSKEKPR